MTPKPKFTVLTMRTTSVLITFPSEVIWITFRAHLQFHSDPSSSTRILEFFVRLDLFTRMLESFTRKTIFHSDDYNFTRKTIFHSDDYISLGRQYLTRTSSFHSDGNLFTRNNFTRMIISLGLLYFHSEANLLLDRFSYKICLNPRSYATWRGKSRSGCVFSREIQVKSLPSE